MNNPATQTVVEGATNAKQPVKASGDKLEKTTVKADVKPGESASKDTKVTKPKKSEKNDQFGFRKGTKTSLAAEMYAKGDGATTEEITKAFGHAHRNLFKKVGEHGWTQEFAYVKNDKGALVKKYKLVKKAQKK